MKLSIIIVNYNVKYFLEQCLLSVKEAIKDIDAEVIVVDNNSVDGSSAMMKDKFPDIQLIENKQNIGFSKANNQAIKKCNGEYILLLNPDTVVEEDSFKKCIEFMDRHPNAGALTVKMIDGKGNFLPESKRAMPTPAVSFYKIFGFSRLFPRSKKFARYHLGHLSEHEIHQIEILPGAFMFMRKSALEKSGLLDENFFMYGEDIDLSYRILQAGYTNYYYPETTIIHYKGESTKKGSINYVMLFYKAMIIFAQKHFSKRHAKIYSTLIHSAIYFRAFLAIISRFLKKMALPSLDFIMIYLFYYLFKPVWESYKFHGSGSYPEDFLYLAVPSYIILWIFGLWMNRGYDKNFSFWNILKGILTGTAIILIIYALLPESYRFSRALILIGTLAAIFLAAFNRLLVHKINFLPHQYINSSPHRIIMAGKQDEIARVKEMLHKIKGNYTHLGNVAPSSREETGYLGSLDQLKEIVKINKVDEVIFCARDIPSQEIIQLMLQLSIYDIDFKIAQPDSVSIIGSNSIHDAGELYTIEINSISDNSNRRNKRLLDILTSIFVLLLSPVFLMLLKKSFQLLNNSILVLLACKTWVGYIPDEGVISGDLPQIKKGVFYPVIYLPNNKQQIERVNLEYAKNYRSYKDLQIILAHLRKFFIFS